MTVTEIALFILLSFRCLPAQAGAAQNEQQHDFVSKVSLKLHNTNTIFLFSSWFVFLNSNLILGEHTQSRSYYVDIPSWNTTDSQESPNQKSNMVLNKTEFVLLIYAPCHCMTPFIFSLCLETKHAGPGLSIKTAVIWPRAVMDPWGLLSCFTLVTCARRPSSARGPGSHKKTVLWSRIAGRKYRDVYLDGKKV